MPYFALLFCLFLLALDFRAHFIYFMMVVLIMHLFCRHFYILLLVFFQVIQYLIFFNLLSLPNPFVGYILQIGCVIIGVVLLLNFLIAMMSTIYDKYQENSKDEYRWVLTTEIAKLRGPNPWPVPLNILQPIVGLMAFFLWEFNACEYTSWYL